MITTIIIKTNPFFLGKISQSLYDCIENYRKEINQSKINILT